ncbi:hypothetical protein [Jannaschia sp. M317]|uniref:hypothetical protein n=1 Tax=Jannaschia sp. M317 TaxID=2867011 RepID=UPI0021A5E12E|nr:hypothetical protein [Jannaschia sp. M317]UWQ17605.1 hypothetical protein K3551_17295 [Jannaschia sp. M317]
MQFDRLLSQTMTRITRAGQGLRKQAPADAVPLSAAMVKDDLRGSGSWANDWAKGRKASDPTPTAAPARTKRRPAAPAAAVDSIPEGTIRARPLMSTRDVKLHQWISDRLEAEAPTCALHAGVALGAFLVSAETRDGYDPLAGLVADLLISDDQGQPLVVLIRENRAHPARQILLLDALMDAGLPIVDIQPRPSLSALWSGIADHLPRD